MSDAVPSEDGAAPGAEGGLKAADSALIQSLVDGLVGTPGTSMADLRDFDGAQDHVPQASATPPQDTPANNAPVAETSINMHDGDVPQSPLTRISTKEEADVTIDKTSVTEGGNPASPPVQADGTQEANANPKIEIGSNNASTEESGSGVKPPVDAANHDAPPQPTSTNTETSFDEPEAKAKHVTQQRTPPEAQTPDEVQSFAEHPAPDDHEAKGTEATADADNADQPVAQAKADPTTTEADAQESSEADPTPLATIKEEGAEADSDGDVDVSPSAVPAFPDADADADDEDDGDDEGIASAVARTAKSAKSHGGISAVSLRTGQLWQSRLAMCHSDTAKRLKAPDAGDVFEATLFHVAAASSDNATLLSKAVSELAADADGGGIDSVDALGRTPLMWAAACGVAPSIKYLLGESCDITLTDSTGASALHWAAAQGQRAAVDALLTAGSDPMVKDASGATPLHLACLQSEGATAALIIKRFGASGDIPTLVNAVDGAGLSSMHWCGLYGRNKPLASLLQSQAETKLRDKTGATPAHISAASSLGSLAALKLLLKADVSCFSEQDHDGCFPVHRAAGNNAKKVIAVLARTKGVDLDAKDSSGRRALHWACALGHVDAVKALISGGCDLVAPDDTGATALHIALQHGKLKSAAVLLTSKRAKLTANARDNEGRTPLFWAVYSKSVPALALLAPTAELTSLDNDGISALHAAVAIASSDVVAFLLQRGTPVDILSREGRTPLMHAIETPGLHHIVDELLGSGASVTTIDSEGKTPLHYAAIAGNADYVGLFTDRHADIRAVDARGETALHYAAFFGHLDVVVLLVQLGASVNAVDLDGVAPLHWACMHGYVDIVSVLVEQFGAEVNVMERGAQRATPLDHALIGDPENPNFVECAKILYAHNAWTALELYEAASRLIQRCLRGALSRRRTAVLRQDAMVKKSAATVVQAHFRGYSQRRRYRQLLKEDAAARVITRTLRKAHDKRRLIAAITVQRVYRGYAVRKVHGPAVEEARQAGLDKLFAHREWVRIEAFKGTPEYAELVRKAKMAERQKAWSRRARKAQQEKLRAAKEEERRKAEKLRKDKAAAAAQKQALRRTTSMRLQTEASVKVAKERAAKAHTERAQRHIQRIQLANARHVQDTRRKRKTQQQQQGSLRERTFVNVQQRMAAVYAEASSNDPEDAGPEASASVTPKTVGTKSEADAPARPPLGALRAPRQARLKVLAEPGTRRLAEVHHLLTMPRPTGSNTVGHRFRWVQTDSAVSSRSLPPPRTQLPGRPSASLPVLHRDARRNSVV